MASKQSQYGSKDIFTLTAEALGIGNVSYIFSGKQLVNCSHFAAERILSMNRWKFTIPQMVDIRN